MPAAELSILVWPRDGCLIAIRHHHPSCRQQHDSQPGRRGGRASTKKWGRSTAHASWQGPKRDVCRGARQAEGRH